MQAQRLRSPRAKAEPVKIRYRQSESRAAEAARRFTVWMEEEVRRRKFCLRRLALVRLKSASGAIFMR